MDKYYENILNQTCELIKIPSILAGEKENMPFGQEIDRALKSFVKMCEEIGLEVYVDPNGYYAYADTPGEGEPQTIVIGHLDVVDTGNLDNWLIPPFAAVVDEKYIHGRGTQDMKLANVVVLNAIKKLLDEGHIFKEKLRFLIGLDEECEFRGAYQYAKENKMPKQGFTPDGKFGITNCETSIINFEVLAEEKADFEIGGGTGYNTVPDYCYYKGKDIQKIFDYMKSKDWNVKITGDKLEVYGLGYHVAQIESGINAVQQLVYALNKCEIESKMLKYVYDTYKLTTDSSPLNGKLSDKFSGNIVSNVGKLIIKDGYQSLWIDMRIPVLIDEKMILKLHKEQIEKYELEYKEYFMGDKVLVNEEAHISKTLLDAYEKVTGISNSVKRTRGGSYSKIGDNIVAFGMNFPDLGQEELAHQANEKYELKYIPLAFEIYYEAIKNLTK